MNYPQKYYTLDFFYKNIPGWLCHFVRYDDLRYGSSSFDEDIFRHEDILVLEAAFLNYIKENNLKYLEYMIIEYKTISKIIQRVTD